MHQSGSVFDALQAGTRGTTTTTPIDIADGTYRILAARRNTPWCRSLPPPPCILWLYCRIPPSPGPKDPRINASYMKHPAHFALPDGEQDTNLLYSFTHGHHHHIKNTRRSTRREIQPIAVMNVVTVLEPVHLLDCDVGILTRMMGFALVLTRIDCRFYVTDVINVVDDDI